MRGAARAFGIPFVLEVPPRFGGALDEAAFVPWQDLSDAFHRLGREDVPRFVDGFTVELGSMNTFSMLQGVEDAKRIASALRHYGVLEGLPDEPAYKIAGCAIADYRSIMAPAGGLVDPVVTPGTPVRKGDLIARIVDVSRIRRMPPLSSHAVLEVRAPEAASCSSSTRSRRVPKGVRLDDDEFHDLN
jgi:hypothetical protein